MYHLTFIQVHRFSFHIHPGCVWIPSRPPRLTSHIHPGCVSPQSRSRYLHLTSLEVTSYFYPDPENCISSPPRFHLKPIPVLISTPSTVSLTYNDVQKRLVSPTSMYQLTTFPVPYRLASPKTLTRPFLLKYVKPLGSANQASLPLLQAPWGVTHEWTAFVLPSGLPVVM